MRFCVRCYKFPITVIARLNIMCRAYGEATFGTNETCWRTGMTCFTIKLVRASGEAVLCMLILSHRYFLYSLFAPPAMRFHIHQIVFIVKSQQEHFQPPAGSFHLGTLKRVAS